jgi:hypothetical protein
VGGIVGGILGIRDEIQNPTPGNPVGPIGQAVCNTLSTVGYDGIPLNNRTGPGFVCEPYWNDKGFDPPSDSPPFTGGQCPVAYNVTGQAILCLVPGQQQVVSETVVTGSNIVGPILGGGSNVQQGTADCPATGNAWGVYVERSAGPEFVQIGRETSSNITVAGFQINSVTRVDGQPDDCGDPPPTGLPGPNTPGTPYGSPAPLPGYPGVDIVVNPPVLPPGGAPPYWPIEIRDPDGTPVGPPIFWTPDGIPPELPPPPPPPVEPGNPQEPSDPTGDVPDDIQPEDEDEGVETIGYEWTLTGLPGNLSQIPGTSPAVLTTPYGNVQLRYEDGTGATRYSDNLPIRVVSGSIVRQDPRLTVKGVLYSRRPDVGGIRLVPLRARRV